MASVRFSAIVKKIDLTTDVKLTLQLLHADDDAINLVPMRATRVWVEMETEQPDVDDVRKKNEAEAKRRSDAPAQQTLNFDETGFQVPAEPGTHLAVVESPADAPAGGALIEFPPPMYDGPVAYVCGGCGWRLDTLDGACAACGGTEFAEVPAELVEATADSVDQVDPGAEPEVIPYNQAKLAEMGESTGGPPSGMPSKLFGMERCPVCGDRDGERDTCGECEGYGWITPANSEGDPPE